MFCNCLTIRPLVYIRVATSDYFHAQLKIENILFALLLIRQKENNSTFSLLRNWNVQIFGIYTL